MVIAGMLYGKPKEKDNIKVNLEKCGAVFSDF
jgi:hypothetical protein